MKRGTILLAALLALPASSCQLLTGVASAEAGFSAWGVAGYLILDNDSPAAVHYVALEEETATRVDLYYDPSRWPAVAPGQRVYIPYAELTGYHPGANRAIVYRATRESPGIRSLRVRLR